MKLHIHIHESNLIENIDDEAEDLQSLIAWRWLEKQEEITLHEVRKIQKIITINQDLRPDERGYWRKCDVWVGGHLCPEWTYLPTLIGQWMKEFDKRPPLQNHIAFEQIHPFVDGNGRTGRMLMWWQEMKLGDRPTIFKFSERQEYYKLFK